MIWIAENLFCLWCPTPVWHPKAIRLMYGTPNCTFLRLLEPCEKRQRRFAERAVFFLLLCYFFRHLFFTELQLKKKRIKEICTLPFTAHLERLLPAWEVTVAAIWSPTVWATATAMATATIPTYSTEDPWGPPIQLTSEVSPEGILGAIFRRPDIDLRCQLTPCNPSPDPHLMDLVPITTSRPPMRFQGNQFFYDCCTNLVKLYWNQFHKLL